MRFSTGRVVIAFVIEAKNSETALLPDRPHPPYRFANTVPNNRLAYCKSVLITTLMLANTLAHSADLTNNAVQQRINHVINGLLIQDAQNRRHFSTATLAERMEHYHTPGVSIAVINDGHVEWALGFGVTESGSTNLVTETTLFQAASISKPVFALAVMRLVQDGKLNLDNDVNDYLKSWKVPPGFRGQPRVTLRQILGHTAGFTVHGFAGYSKNEPLPSLVEILDGRPPAHSSPIRVTLTPGSQYRYSGGGVEVAQQVVMDVTGKPFPQFMQTTVITPLGMSHSTYEQQLPKEWESRVASGHTTNGTVIPGRWHVYPEMAAAGLWTTPSDLARVGMDLQHALAGQSGTLLPQSAIAEMLKPGLGQVGISFFITGNGDAVRFSHSGANAGFRSQMAFCEKRGLGCVIMANGDGADALLAEIERAIAREYAWLDRAQAGE